MTLLVKRNKPLSVIDIQSALAQKVVHAHITTVYRELALLQKEGFVIEVQFGENKKLYELTPTDHHHHLVCLSCNDVQDIILDNDLDAAEHLINRTTRFKVTSHSLEFFGTCATCQP